MKDKIVISYVSERFEIVLQSDKGDSMLTVKKYATDVYDFLRVYKHKGVFEAVGLAQILLGNILERV